MANWLTVGCMDQCINNCCVCSSSQHKTGCGHIPQVCHKSSKLALLWSCTFAISHGHVRRQQHMALYVARPLGLCKGMCIPVDRLASIPIGDYRCSANVGSTLRCRSCSQACSRRSACALRRRCGPRCPNCACGHALQRIARSHHSSLVAARLRVSVRLAECPLL